jgi:pantoate--beta-alanine ligase
VRELNLPIEVIGAPTVRSQDGLALSSRNGYLSAAERLEAPRLVRVLRQVVEAIRAGERDLARLEREAMDALAAHGWRPQYVAVRQALDLRAPTALQCAAAGPDAVLGNPPPWVVLGAAYLGTTRLIDNLDVADPPNF